jgi:hypothetical protein
MVEVMIEEIIWVGLKPTARLRTSRWSSMQRSKKTKEDTLFEVNGGVFPKRV